MSEYSNNGFEQANRTINSYKSASDFDRNSNQNSNQSSDRVYGKLVQRAPEAMSDLLADQFSRDYVKVMSKQEKKDQLKINIMKKNDKMLKIEQRDKFLKRMGSVNDLPESTK